MAGQISTTDPSLYTLLGLSQNASDAEVRRAYKRLLTKSHPDKGGDVNRFARLHKAYQVLSTPDQRKLYDETGKFDLSVEEQFAETFGNGNFKTHKAGPDQVCRSLSEQIVIQQTPTEQSHTAGFDAWLRMRGDQTTSVFTADTAASTFGVVEGSYKAVPLPATNLVQVMCNRAGHAQEVTEVVCKAAPFSLGWGEVLVSIQLASINPADTYTIRTGGLYGDEQTHTPFVCGHDGVGFVQEIGEGVKRLMKGDCVVPANAHMGTWRSAAVWQEAHLLKMPPGSLAEQHGAMWRELCLAYCLLQEHGNLKPGVCVILNAANSTVGQALVQLCRLLRLRCVAVIRQHREGQQEHEQKVAWLQFLGADLILEDTGSLKAELEKQKFFAKPKLALDYVGADSTVRLSDALAPGGHLVIYGCLSGKAPTWSWHCWVFQDLQVTGFNLRKWLTRNSSRVQAMLEALGRLVNANKLKLECTEYDFPSEFPEALEHALSSHQDTKVLLRMAGV